MERRTLPNICVEGLDLSGKVDKCASSIAVETTWSRGCVAGSHVLSGSTE